MNQVIVCIALRGADDHWISLPLLLAAVLVAVCDSYWRFVVQWLQDSRTAETDADGESAEVNST
jgi:hypothetical protein